ncbi:flagellar biosynthetic protein FliO [Rhizobium halophytocola]|uniref:Flagellar biosynthesis protein FliO n=1 Tax=Rhizobium halophytocola TaxID=735519 RepID=A0ABS4DZ97_9HYPH|nr:flagellar biosynthetic protein FliO [Rhizobium halophytocola]MBP1851000.1 hypothetical protein [Rhizobium halophytocola]
MLDDMVSAYGNRFLVAALGVSLALLGLFVVLWVLRHRAPSPFVRGGRNRQPRLQVLDAAAIDARRRLVLVRRDNVEHLVMIGGPTDIVIESGIGEERPYLAVDRAAETAGAVDSEPRLATPEPARQAAAVTAAPTMPVDVPSVPVRESRPATPAAPSRGEDASVATASIDPPTEAIRAPQPSAPTVSAPPPSSQAPAASVEKTEPTLSLPERLAPVEAPAPKTPPPVTRTEPVLQAPAQQIQTPEIQTPQVQSPQAPVPQAQPEPAPALRAQAPQDKEPPQSLQADPDFSKFLEDHMITHLDGLKEGRLQSVTRPAPTVMPPVAANIPPMPQHAPAPARTTTLRPEALAPQRPAAPPGQSHPKEIRPEVKEDTNLQQEIAKIFGEMGGNRRD